MKGDGVTEAAAGATVWLGEGQKLMSVRDLIPYDKNPRKISDKAVDGVAKSIREFGFSVPIVIDAAGVIITGHTRRLAAIKLGLAEVPVIVRDDLTEAQVRAFRIADNRVSEASAWDKQLLAFEISDLVELGLDELTGALGFSDKELDKLLDMDLVLPGERTETVPKQPKGKPAAAFDVVPSTLLDPKGRVDEMLIRWFSPQGGLVLDPFCGKSARGAVATQLGREYVGTDFDETILREAEAAKNTAAALVPTYRRHDARAMNELPASIVADLIILDLPRFGAPGHVQPHLSALSLPDYITALRKLAEGAAGRLKPNRFVAVLASDARIADGPIAGIEWRLQEAFEAAGLKLYNSAAVSTGPLTEVGPAFDKLRRLTRAHRSLFLFVKGDGRTAARDLGTTEFKAIGG